MSLKEKLAKAATPQPFPVEIEAWGGETVHLLPMDQHAMDEHNAAIRESENATAVMMATVLHQLVDEQGDLVFDLDDDEDIALAESFDLGGYRECFDALCDRALGNEDRRAQETKKRLRSVTRKRRRKS